MEHVIGFFIILIVGLALMACWVGLRIQRINQQIASQLANERRVFLRLQREAVKQWERESELQSIVVRADITPPYEFEYRIHDHGETVRHVVVVWPKSLDLTQNGNVAISAAMGLLRRQIEKQGIDAAAVVWEEIDLSSMGRVAISVSREAHRRLVALTAEPHEAA